jgi:hypothetical protein
MEPLAAAAHAVEAKVEEFITTNPKFQESLNHVFQSVDFDVSGEIGPEEAALSVAWLFDSIQDALSDYGKALRVWQRLTFGCNSAMNTRECAIAPAH